MAKLFTGYGAVVASFAVLQGMAPNGKLYWIRALEQGGYIYGPYVNHNHYAGLMEMLTPFPLVLAATQLHRREPQDCGGGNRRADGGKYLSFRFARRHGGVRRADGGARRPSGSQARGKLETAPHAGRVSGDGDCFSASGWVATNSPSA